MAGLNIPLREDLKIPRSDNSLSLLTSWQRDENEIMVSGPRNCSKTLLCLWYVLTIHQLVPNLKSALLRSEYKSITSTVLRTIRDRLLRYPFADERNPFTLYGGENRPEHITFANGGQMDFRGLDGKGKALGAEYDLIYINQAERETRPEVWGDILGTIAGGRGRNWRGPKGERYWQLIADANPSTPYHFLYKRKEAGKIAWLDFTHKDNPTFYNWKLDKWYKHGLETIEALKNSYDGYSYQRMVEGKWVAAEGMVYPQFKQSHIKPLKREMFGAGTRWYASIDWGGTSMTAVCIYAVVDDRYYIFKEFCRAQMMVSDVLDSINRIQRDYNIPQFHSVFVDHNSEHVLQCQNRGLLIELADKSVVEGIETVRRIIREDRLIVNKDSIDERDPNSPDSPQGFAEEVMAYAYRAPGERTLSGLDELPVKKNDHSCDAVRYALHSLEGSVLELPDFTMFAIDIS